jgi:hypothetical protein
MAKMGRRPIEIDWKMFDGFCAMQCTLWEIACYFNCSEDTIENKVKQQFGVSFSDYYSKKRISGLMSLRRNLFRQSEKNPAVAIFLAKNWLGMKDDYKFKHSGDKDEPVEVKIDAKEKLLSYVNRIAARTGEGESDKAADG